MRLLEAQSLLSAKLAAHYVDEAKAAGESHDPQKPLNGWPPMTRRRRLGDGSSWPGS